ncbi:MAG: phosphotransferase [Gemmatimonadales bacterium]
MSERLLDGVPEAHRQTARQAVADTLGWSAVTAFEPVRGGASGALTYRVDAGARSYLLRMETRRDRLRNPHQYTCMEIAAEAGVAPPLRHVDGEAGVALMDFLPERPLQEYPGGPASVARALGSLVARLQDTPVFPVLHEYPALLRRMLAFLGSSGMFAEGLLDAHAEGFERVLEAYGWDASSRVSSHNDPNPRNILFDGRRLWLVDWEAACANDPLTDVAIVADNLAATPELEADLLHAWLGRAPDGLLRARLTLMRLLTRFYYAAILLSLSRRAQGEGPETDLTALTPAELAAAVARGELEPASSEIMWALGKMTLAHFRAGLDADGLEEAMATARSAVR